MNTFLFGTLVTVIALIIALTLGNIVIFILLRDAPLLWILRGRARDVEVIEDITYMAGSKHPKHRLDFYRPKDLRDVPMVVFVHGGHWISGNKTLYPSLTDLYTNVGTALAREGVACAVINYRLAPAVPFEAMFADVIAAIRFAQISATDFGCDPNAIYVMGHGAGGHLVAFLATNQDQVRTAGVNTDGIKGYVCMSAVYDLTDMAASRNALYNETVTRTVFGTDPEVLRRYSPVTHFSLGVPPMLILTGEKDHSYLVKQAETIFKKLTELHGDPVAFIIPGYTHTDMVGKFGRNNDQTVRKVIEFVKRDRL